MAGFLSSLFGKKTPPPAPPILRLSEGLSGHITQSGSLPSIVVEKVAQHAAPLSTRDRERLWNEVKSEWLHAVADSLEGSPVIFESEDFLLLATIAEDEGSRLVKMADRISRRATEDLPGVAVRPGAGKQILASLDTAATARLGSPTKEGISGTAIKLYGPTTPLVIIGKLSDGNNRRTVAAAIAELLLGHLDLPHWLRMSMVYRLQNQAEEFEFPWENSDDARAARKAFWTPEHLAAFRSATPPKATAEEELYSADLALKLTQDLLKPYEDFVNFCTHASSHDNGEAAAKEAWDMTVNELILRSAGT